MSLGGEDGDWTAWAVWTIIKWSGISVLFLMAIGVGWLLILAAVPARV
jgi:hypothetical protein